MAIIRKPDGSIIHIEISKSGMFYFLKDNEYLNDILMGGNCEIIEATTNEQTCLEQAYTFKTTPE